MHEGSMIVTDLKGEIFRSTAGYRKAKGSQVFLFAPGSARTHRYNPLDFIRPDRGDRTTDIQNIASILVPENTESENSIWQATAQQLMAGVISYISESGFYEGRRNLAEVTSFFNSGTNLQALMAYIKEKEPHLSRFTLESFNAYIALSERAAASALLDIQKALRPFRNERIAAATTVTDMDLRALKHRPISIYLAPNITDITLLKPLLALFVQQTLDTLMLEHSTRSVPVYFLFDEFRQLKKMSEITTKLPYVAGYNIKMAFIIQDLKNLDEIYGETSRHSLMGNCGYQLVFGANDQVTAESISKGLGKRTVRYNTESRTMELMGLHRRTKVEQLRERDLMMPQEVRQMPAGKMIILAEGQGPIFADKLRFFATAPFERMEAFARANVPDVPAVELLPPTAAPATTDTYAQSTGGEVASALAISKRLADRLWIWA
jgi:type IV secretion system protein VirD4